jgi:hypothetical protein
VSEEPSGHGWIDELVPVLSPAGPPWLAMGLARIDEERWLLPDAAQDAELVERRRLLDDRPHAVLGCLPGTEAASEELLALVLAWERAHRPDLAAVPIDPATHPLEAAGRRVQEDLVLMVGREGRYHLDAAVLCFPSHWRLADKLGGSAAAIHGPVPGYGAELEAKVDRFFDRLRPGVVTARRNWSVHDDAALHAPDPPLDPEPVPAAEVGHRLWLRSERQTLRRLPASGAIAFTIKVQQVPFSALLDHPRPSLALAARLRAQPAALTAMNGLAPHRAAVLAWLDAHGRGSSPSSALRETGGGGAVAEP